MTANSRYWGIDRGDEIRPWKWLTTVVYYSKGGLQKKSWKMYWMKKCTFCQWCVVWRAGHDHNCRFNISECLPTPLQGSASNLLCWKASAQGLPCLINQWPNMTTGTLFPKGKCCRAGLMLCGWNPVLERKNWNKEWSKHSSEGEFVGHFNFQRMARKGGQGLHCHGENPGVVWVGKFI